MTTPLEVVNDNFRYITENNAEAIIGGYHDSEELYVILEGPRLSNRGIGPISKGWRDFTDSIIDLRSVNWTEGPFTEETPEMAWVAGVIELSVAVRGRTFSQTFRATFVLTRQGGRWRIKHEHVSAAHADPYGIGDWLQQ